MSVNSILLYIKGSKICEDWG